MQSKIDKKWPSIGIGRKKYKLVWKTFSNLNDLNLCVLMNF